MALILVSNKKGAPRRDRRTWLERRAYELSKRCPIERSNPVNCPLFGLRPLQTAERKTWIHRLSDDELEYLATYHTCCFAEKSKVTHS